MMIIRQNEEGVVLQYFCYFNEKQEEDESASPPASPLPLSFSLSQGNKGLWPQTKSLTEYCSSCFELCGATNQSDFSQWTIFPLILWEARHVYKGRRVVCFQGKDLFPFQLTEMFVLKRRSTRETFNKFAFYWTEFHSYYKNVGTFHTDEQSAFIFPSLRHQTASGLSAFSFSMTEFEASQQKRC